MKRIWWMLPALALLLSGCQAAESVEDSLRKEIDELKQQIEQMGEDAAPPIEELTGVADLDEKHAGLSETVDAFMKKVAQSDPSDTELDKYFTLMKEHNQIERDLDSFEDSLEKLHLNGTITRDEYRARETKLDELEDKLDKAEDDLERVYGIKD